MAHTETRAIVFELSTSHIDGKPLFRLCWERNGLPNKRIGKFREILWLAVGIVSEIETTTDMVEIESDLSHELREVAATGTSAVKFYGDYMKAKGDQHERTVES